jgi:hypothetical protein
VGKFAVRFDPDEMTELRNTQQVDIIGNKIKTVYDKFMSSIQQRFFMSQYERFQLDDNSTLSTSTRGFLAQQADAGVGVIDVTTANFTDILRQAIFDIQLSGSEDLILAGTGRSLEYAGLGEKSERLRYSVGDKLYDMSLTKYNFWGHSVIPMRVDVWEDRGMYGNAMANDLVLFRKSDVALTYLQNGRPMISRKHTLINQTDNPERASIYDLHLMWYEGLFGVEGHKMAFTRRFRLQSA